MNNVDNFQLRVKELIRILKEGGIDGYVFGATVNMYYIANFFGIQRERLVALFLPTSGEPFFIIPELNREQIAKSTWVSNIITWSDGEDPFEKLTKIIIENKMEKSQIAIDNTLRSDFLLALQKILPGVNFINGNEFISDLRRKKNYNEKKLMMKAGNVHDKVYKEVISSIKIGMSEIEIANLVESTFKDFGGKCASPVPIVASGANTAQPHYLPTNKTIVNGEPILIDCSSDCEHYKSDMTRNVFIGKPSKDYMKIYDIVRRAQETCVKKVKPGKSCEEIDKIARDIITDEGYGKYFIHRTGHGIGLEAHEEPNIVEGNKLILEPGMCFSIEPGIYLPNNFGIRLEDCVIVTENGAEAFTDFPHELIIK